MRKSSVSFVVLLSAALGAIGCGDAAGPALQSQAQVNRAIQSVYPALVRIHVVMTEASEGRIRKMEGAGSGAIISSDGYVITNHHVAGRSARLVCRLADRQEIDATLVGTDPLCDIAVLKLKLDERKDPNSPLPVAAFGDSSLLRVGQPVLAMGSPAGLSQSVTLGVVSNLEMILPGGGLMMEGESVGNLVRWIGHDAYIYHGNSGGPLVNMQGQIVGINEMGVAGLGGAIPGNIAKSIADQIIHNPDHKIHRSYCGLECQAMLKGSASMDGVLVSGVTPGSPAALAGVRSGDVMTEFDGHKVHVTVDEELPLLHQLIMTEPIGKKVRVAVLREGKSMAFDLTLTAREPAIAKDEEIKAWGFTAMDLTLRFAQELQRSDKSGVLVESVRPGGQCSEAKPAIVAGDVIVEVNRKAVHNLEQLRSLTKELTQDGQASSEALVGFERGVKKYLTVVKIGKEPAEDKPMQARKAWIGVATQVLTKDLARALNLEGHSGVRITQVLGGTEAKKAGLKVGDVLLTLDGDEISASQVEDEEVFANMVRRHKRGTEAALGLVRDGKSMTLNIKLEDSPRPSSDFRLYENDDFEFAAREMTAFDRQNRKLTGAAKGLLIERIDAGGWSSLAGMGVGDILLSVDGKEVNDIQMLQQALKAAKENKAKRLVFFVKRGIHSMYLELEPDWK
jgi:serine protease Do